VRRLFLFVVALSVTAVMVGACKKADPEADKAAIRALVEEDTTYFKSSTERDYDDTTMLSLAGDTTLKFWMRGPQEHDSVPVIDVEVTGDSAVVTWFQHNYGQLLIWPNIPETTGVLWVKELTERVELSAVFLRQGRETDDNRGWTLNAVSLAAGQSELDSSVRIDSVRIASSLRDIVIADPLGAFYRVDSLMWFTPGELLTITLYTNVPDGQAFLHTFLGVVPVRIPFDSEGEGRFTGTWHAQLFPWLRFAIFDVVSRNTLYHPTEPYGFRGWLLPYLIKAAD
jgi:hypothetical protein